MANTDAAYGFLPVKHYGGGTIRMNAYTIADGYSTIALFTGDPVKMTGTDDNIEIAAAASGGQIGVFAGCQYETLDGQMKFSRYWPKSQALKTGTLATAYVWDDPQILFKCQSSGTTTTADIGTGIDGVATAGGSTVTGTSGWELASSTGGVALKIMGLYNHPNNAHGLNAELLVLWGEHELAGARTMV